MSDLSAFLSRVEALVKAVRFDEHGEMVAGQWVGGNGGLLSRETMVLNDLVWTELENRKRWYGNSDDPRPDPTIIFGEVVKDLEASKLDQRTVRLVVDAFIAKWRA